MNSKLPKQPKPGKPAQTLESALKKQHSTGFYWKDFVSDIAAHTFLADLE